MVCGRCIQALAVVRAMFKSRLRDTDPITQVTGYGPLSGYMSELHKNVPGVGFVTTDFKSHHDRSLTHWNMVDGKGNILSQGASYGMYGTDGRLTQMTGFFELPGGG